MENQNLSHLLIKNPSIYFLPGVTSQSIDTCFRLLEDNHQHYHVFFNKEHAFHNHTSHHLLAALGFGASSKVLERIYNEQKKQQMPIEPLHKKDEFDVKKCMGNDNYYHDYLEFFRNELESKKYENNIDEMIEDYLFNKDYLVHFLSGAFHSFIHLGYALEFQSKLMAIEEHLNWNKDGNKTALEIIELISQDQQFANKLFYKKGDFGSKVAELLDEHVGSLIAEYAQMWKCDLNDLRRADILINAGVLRRKKQARLDFFLMHATTSSLFLDIFVHSFKNKENQSKFLRAKFATDLVYYIARGRPKLDLNYLFNDYQVSKEHLYSDTHNPWLPLIEKSLTHPDEHVMKSIRALVYAEKFDSAEDKEKIPYLKIAQMTMDVMFPFNEKNWTHEGIGWDEFWKTVPDL
ncbi:unnamed protein product [Adineta ricciae]|uniref:Uncharacterized protein n=1 Tax=Adineta ricciae TaxID=249248 RepID=A0A815X0X5_ADIRI|nr:unnamed protein product [Adineta ricciae]